MKTSWHTPPIGFATSTTQAPPVLASEQLMTKWEATGSFWVPSQPTRKFWGSISFRPGDGTSVILEGNFSERYIHPNQELHALHGTLFNGAQCTLFACKYSVETYHGHEDRHRTFADSKLCVIGGHFETLEDCQIEYFQLRLSHLDQWFDNPYKIKYEGEDWKEARLNFDADALSADFEFNGVQVRLGTFCGRSMPMEATPEGAAWPFQYNLMLFPAKTQQLSWFLQLAASLRDLFVFLVGSGVYTLAISGKPQAPAERDHIRLSIFIPVTVPRVVRTESRYFSTRHSTFRESLPHAICEWFSRQSELAVAIRTYTELLCSDGISRQTVLLRTAQTLEHLHGLLWPSNSKYVSQATYRQLTRWLRTHFPTELGVPEAEFKALQDHKEIIVDRFAGLNELSFRSRMEKIFRSIPGPELMPLIRNPHDSEVFLTQFLKQLETSRHYLTHFDEKQRAGKFSDDELQNASLTCWAVLTFWIAHLIGLSDEEAGHVALQARDALFLVGPREPL
jgi:ApeA N-terminal domain 1